MEGNLAALEISRLQGVLEACLLGGARDCCGTLSPRITLEDSTEIFQEESLTFHILAKHNAGVFLWWIYEGGFRDL